MRKTLVILFALLLVVPLVAQEGRIGRIIGQVVDQDDNPIPGVMVTLLATAGAPTQAITTAEGSFRFMALPPSTGYALKAELEGFKTRTETGIIVEIGKTTDITLAMEMGALEEEVTVVAVSPVVEVKKTSLSTTLNYETLQSLPSARDPWVILQMTPAVQVDRENVGGSESGQQSGFIAMGGGRAAATWTVDGVDITDPAAQGASPGYYDFDVFEEVNITVGGADVEQQTSGVSLNMVSRRGENRITFGGRFYYTESAFQSTPTGDTYDEIEAIFPGYGYNKIRDIKDFGFNVGGPLFKDRIWWWGSYGVQEIKTTPIFGGSDDTSLNNYAGKVNIQIIPENRLELFIHAGDKKKFGRDSSTTLPMGRNQHGKYHFGSPIVKIQDEHMFGDSFFVSVKYGFSDAGFGLWPRQDEDLEDMRRWDVENQVNSWGYSWFMTERPNTQFSAQGTYFNDDFLGASHEIKFGGEYMVSKQGSVSGNAGNMMINYNYHTPTADWDGDGTRDVVRDDFNLDWRRLYFYRGNTSNGPRQMDRLAFFLADTMTWGRLTAKLGVRYDRQTPSDPIGRITDTIFQQDSDALYLENYYEIQQRYLAPGVGDAIGSIFPGNSSPPISRSETQSWNNISPRIGLTYDLTGDGKTIVKLSGAIYYARMYSGTSYLWRQTGTGGGLNFYWNDTGDDVVQFNELYWTDYSTSARTAYRAFADDGTFLGNWDREEGLHWSGYTPTDPTALSAPRYHVDPDFNGDGNTQELIAALERELMPDLSVGLDLTWRKYWGWWTNRNFADVAGGQLLDRSFYTEAPHKVPSSYTTPDGETLDFGDAAGRPFYVLKEGIPYIYDLYTMQYPKDYNDQYYGLTLRFNKRLSNRWMLNGSLGLQNTKTTWGKDWPENPTNQWSRDGQTYSMELGAPSGKVGMQVFSRWMLKAQGLYQLPYDFNISFTFNAREGHILPQQIDLNDYDSPNSRDTSETMDLYTWASERLPTFWNLNMRLEKILRVGDTGRIFLMVDVFNVFNQNILNRQRTYNPGDLYLHNDPITFSRNTLSAEPNEVLNPRIFRFGVRFQF